MAVWTPQRQRHRQEHRFINTSQSFSLSDGHETWDTPAPGALLRVVNSPFDNSLFFFFFNFCKRVRYYFYSSIYFEFRDIYLVQVSKRHL